MLAINAFYNIGKEFENIANGDPASQSNVYVAPDAMFDARKIIIVHDSMCSSTMYINCTICIKSKTHACMNN